MSHMIHFKKYYKYKKVIKMIQKILALHFVLLYIDKYEGDDFMCKLGDIILVNKFKNEDGEIVSKHSFVVINDEKDSIGGLKYDFVANMM